jgi:hypothetical protein
VSLQRARKELERMTAMRGGDAKAAEATPAASPTPA